VANIGGDDSEAELQGGRGDQQILEGSGCALGRQVAFDAPCDSGRLDSNRMHRHVADQFVHERLTALPAFFRSGALDAVGQFHDGHDGKGDIEFAVTGFELFQDLPDGVAPPLLASPRWSRGLAQPSQLNGFAGAKPFRNQWRLPKSSPQGRVRRRPILT